MQPERDVAGRRVHVERIGDGVVRTHSRTLDVGGVGEERVVVELRCGATGERAGGVDRARVSGDEAVAQRPHRRR